MNSSQSPAERRKHERGCAFLEGVFFVRFNDQCRGVGPNFIHQMS